MLSKEEKKAINSLEKEYKKLEEEGNILFPLFKQQAKTLLNLIEKLQKENEELKSDNLEKERVLEIFDNRKYRKRYLKERRKEESNLLYPDADEIYKRYYELKKQIDLMAKKLNQAYFEEEKFYLWFEKIMGVQEKMDYGYLVDVIKHHFNELAKEKGE